MRLGGWVFVCVVTMVLPKVVLAQEPLTLDQAIQAALAQNASLRAAQAGTRQAAAEATAARAAFFPRVSFGESWQRGNQPVFVFGSLLSARRFAAENFAIDALNHPDATAFYQASVGVEQVVFDGGARRAAARAATLRRDIAGSTADEAASQLALSVTSTFGRVIAAQSAGRAAQAALEAGREDRARVERRRDAGMATDADVLALVVHVADLEQRRISAEGDAAVARAELNRLMGASVDRGFNAVEPIATTTGDDQIRELPALLAEADSSRAELRRAAAAERLAEVGRRQARAALIPQVAAQAGVDVSGLRWSDRVSSWVVGGQLRWTFSTGGAELAQLTAAAEGAARERAQHDDIRAAVHVEVVTALRRLEAARARQAAGRAAVEQARESQRITRDRFEAGIASVNDVLRAATALLDAEANTSAALVDALVSRAMLARAVGRHP